MKKKSGSASYRVLSRIFAIKEWFDWARLKSFNIAFKTTLLNLLVLKKNTHSESFNTAVKKLDLTDEDLLLKQKSLLNLSRLMLFVALVILLYTGYQLFYGSYSAAIVSFIIMLLAVTFAFRYHFWYFQIKQKKLGCTFHEWFRQGLLGEKDE